MNDKKIALQIVKEIIEYHVCNPHPDYDLAMNAIERLSEQPQIVESGNVCEYCREDGTDIYENHPCYSCIYAGAEDNEGRINNFDGRKMAEVKE